MRTINKKAIKFDIGKKVIVKKRYDLGNINVNVGDIGVIINCGHISLPDMGLFDIRVIDIKFSNGTISMGEQICEQYMDILN